MAQGLIRRFVADLADAVELPDPIVEFGSLQVEAYQQGDLRGLFAGRPYTGTDMRPGPGVDRVEDLRLLRFGDGEIGTALCLDTLEHCEDPVQACRELARVTADGGVCAISSVMLFGIHAYPNDYFRFTPEAFRSMLGAFDDVQAIGIGPRGAPMQVIGVGAKGRSLGVRIEQLPSVLAAQAWWDEAPGVVPIGPLRFPPGQLVRALLSSSPRLAQEWLARRVGRGG